MRELAPENDHESGDLILQINEEIIKLEKRIHTVEIKEILNLMGFHENWKNI